MELILQTTSATPSPEEIEMTYLALNLCLVLMVTDDLLRMFANTNYYKQKVKLHANALAKEIQKEMGLIEELFDIDGESMQELFERAGTLVRQAFVKNANDWQIIQEVLSVLTQAHSGSNAAAVLKRAQIVSVLMQGASGAKK